mmetsp:Transcript_15006/g.44956  ORF Transcript_15006/g.44956 Transcript_15006/m.44956 type:complete len:224 (-) Transcript_15006:102-773(-)
MRGHCCRVDACAGNERAGRAEHGHRASRRPPQWGERVLWVGVELPRHRWPLAAPDVGLCAHPLVVCARELARPRRADGRVRRLLPAALDADACAARDARPRSHLPVDAAAGALGRPPRHRPAAPGFLYDTLLVQGAGLHRGNVVLRAHHRTRRARRLWQRRAALQRAWRRLPRELRRHLWRSRPRRAGRGVRWPRSALLDPAHAFWRRTALQHLHRYHQRGVQ